MGEATRYTMLSVYRSLFEDLLGCAIHPGTFNVKLDRDSRSVLEALLDALGPCTFFAPRDARLSRLAIIEALVYGVIEAILVLPEATRHPPDIIELVSCTRLSSVTEPNQPVYILTGCGLLRCHRIWASLIKSLNVDDRISGL